MSGILILDDDKKDSNVDNENIIDEKYSSKKSDNFLDKVNNYLISLSTLKVKEKVVFFRLLSTMLNAWVWVVKSVSILEKQEKSPALKKILGVFIHELKKWQNLSQCLEMYPASFSNAEIWMVKSWEKTWKLNSVLVDLSDQLEKVSSISWKIKSAMMYPLAVICVVIIVIFVMMIFIVPKLLDIFQNKDALPMSTKILIGTSDFFINYWYLIIMFFVVSFVLVTVWKKTPNGRYNYDNLMLKIPVFWDISKKLILSKFARVLSSLISSGVSIVESLQIVSDVVWNDVYRQRILLLKEDVENWIKIWESLDGDKLFPDMMIQMIQVWEQTAKLDETIVKVADFYDEQVDHTISILNKLLEPFIIVFMATVVWFIAIAIMQPILGLADTVSNS